ncbi:MAG: hypothetical protein LBO09_08620 [Candidatus Peribacteria bacterium]|nr:hypothetical protein [Candidatus Peribacteria bacterium]
MIKLKQILSQYSLEKGQIVKGVSKDGQQEIYAAVIGDAQDLHFQNLKGTSYHSEGMVDGIFSLYHDNNDYSTRHFGDFFLYRTGYTLYELCDLVEGILSHGK